MLQKPFAVGGTVITIGCSAGVAISANGALDADYLMSAADRALYRAKTEGRNTWRMAGAAAEAHIAENRTAARRAQPA